MVRKLATAVPVFSDSFAGQGSYKKRKKHFREAVLLPSGVFQHIYFTVLHECDMAFDTHKDRFKTLVDEVFGEILKDLNRITTTPENAAVEADLRKQLLNEVAAAEKQLNGRLAKLLADCERHR